MTLPKGEKVAGLTPAIPSCEPKGDDDVNPDRVSIKLRLDDSAADENSQNEFRNPVFRQDRFVHAQRTGSPYKPYGLSDLNSVDRRFNYFQRCLKEHTSWTVYGEVFAECKDKMLSGYNLEKEASEYSDNEFFEFISKDKVLTNEDIKGKSKKDDVKLMQASLISGDTNCEEFFECMIWFELGKKMWKKHRNVFYEHVEYLKNSIRKPFDMTIMDYIECVHEMWYLKCYLLPPSLKNETYSEELWSMLDEAVNELVIRKSIRDGLPDEMQAQELDAKDDDYRNVDEEHFNEFLINIESADIRKRESKKRAYKNLKVATSQALGSNDLSADDRIPKKKPKKPFKKNGAGIARVCMHCKNAGMPESKYGTHSSDQCGDKEAMMQMASGSLGDRKTVLDRYKKRYKENKKELKKAQKRNAKLFVKATKKYYMKKNEFKRMAKKLARCSEASIDVSDSSSDDDSSVSSDSSSDSE